MTVFFRLLKVDDKGAALISAAKDPQKAPLGTTFEVAPEELTALPQSTFAYWVGPSIRSLYTIATTFGTAAETRRGMSTLDDFRFIRARWEVSPNPDAWKTYSKGDTFRPFFESFLSVAKWYEDGAEVKSYVEAKVGSASRTIQAQDWYFKPGLTWVRRTHRLCMRALPEGAIFSGGAQAVFCNDDTDVSRLAALALVSSSTFDAFTKLSVGRTGDAVQFEPGMVSRVPLPAHSFVSDEMASLAKRAWRINWKIDTANEISHAFVLPALLQVDGRSLEERATMWMNALKSMETELSDIHREIDQRCFELYDLRPEDRLAIEEDLQADGARGAVDEVDDIAISESAILDSIFETNATELSAKFIAWCVGAAFGRFDVRITGSDKRLSSVPGVFDALPNWPPGCLADPDGRPLHRKPEGYPVRFATNGILVDDPGHELDITAAVRSVVDHVFNSSSDGWWTDIGKALAGASEDMRKWLGKSFFPFHLQTYTASRRKAPIFWQLSTASGGYSIWLSAHNMKRDTFLQIQSEILVPKLAQEERELATMRSDGSDTSKKDLEEKQSFIDELRALIEEVKRIAPLWSISLDDGIVIAMSPLWRLMPRHKGWQRELKAKWVELVEGAYDWSHLAMHLWPERVLQKCAVDRSIAIAHGLEDVFWFEREDGKWASLDKPKTKIDQLIRDRASPSVKAALKSLIEAADITSAPKRVRKSKAA